MKFNDAYSQMFPGYPDAVSLQQAAEMLGQTLFSFPTVRGRKEVAHVRKKAFRLLVCAVILLYIFCIKAH